MSAAPLRPTPTLTEGRTAPTGGRTAPTEGRTAPTQGSKALVEDTAAQGIHTISLFVHDRPGVLVRVALVFSRRLLGIAGM